jgi:two-component system CitB family sensor kinase
MLVVVCVVLTCGSAGRARTITGTLSAREAGVTGVRKRRLSTQILVSQLTILVATVLVGFALFAQQERQHLDRQYQDRALAIAQTVAGIPVIREAMEYGDSGNVVQSTAERVRQNSGARYIVVIDLDGVRHSHPTPALIGQRVEEPLVALDGHGHTGVDPGSLGPSANGKAPLYGPTGNLVGEVSAGILESDVDAALYHELPVFGLYFGIALAAGVLASYLLARRLKRTTFGLELHDIATLLQEREAMLHGIREGMLGLDEDGRVTVVNDEARRLLGLGTAGLGRPLSELVAAGRLRDVLSGTVGGPDETVLTDEYCLAVNRMPVRLQGRELGAVVTVRDRTELVGVLRELDNVRGLTDALRAQQHEFANRIHTLAGLIELGDQDQALAFIAEVSARQGEEARSIRDQLGNPLVAALVLAKQTVAAERGVRLCLSADSVLGAATGRSQALLTVLGNLLDNAIDAAGSAAPAGGAGPGGGAGTVELHLTEDEDGITVRVSDSGPGIPADAAAEVFQDGYTTKQPRGELRRGLGLALVQRIVTQAGGTVQLRPGPGAVFTVRLPGVPAAPEVAVR